MSCSTAGKLATIKVLRRNLSFLSAPAPAAGVIAKVLNSTEGAQLHRRCSPKTISAFESISDSDAGHYCAIVFWEAERRPSLPSLRHWLCPDGAWGLGPGASGGLSGAGGLGSGATDGLSGAWGLGDPVSPFFGSRVSAGPAGLGSVLGGDFGEPIGSFAGSGVIAELLTVSSG
jgi:hypothetical protein